MDDLKKMLSWAAGVLIMLLLSMIAFFLQRTVSGIDQLNASMTTIMIKQESTERRLAALEAGNVENARKWMEQEQRTRDFWENYAPARRHE